MKVITLIGSTRHKDAFELSVLVESLAGNVVLSLACFQQADGLNMSQEEIKTLHEVHRAKIRMADEVLVINVERFLGDSTMAELEYAVSIGKTIRFLEHKAMFS